MLVGYGLGLAVLLPVLLLLGVERYSPQARVVAWVGFGLSTLPALVMVLRPQSRRNALAATGLVSAVFYELSVLHERRLMLRWGEARITDSSVELAMVLAALALPAMWLGWHVCGRVNPLRRARLSLELPPRLLRTVGYVIIASSLTLDVLWLRGSITVLESAVGIMSVVTPFELGFSMLMVHRLGGHANRFDQIAFWACLILMSALSLARGQIFFLLRPFIIYLLGWLYIGRRVPVLPVVIMFAAILLMQPVKGTYRALLVQRSAELSVLARVELYLDLLNSYWFSGDQLDTRAAAETAASRTTGALALANVIEMTPASVPHQYGATYRYLLYGPIPRVLYPDKPVAQLADRWAMVVYGYTNLSGTHTVAIGLSQFSEVYINFGFPGCLLMLMVTGAMYRLLDDLLGHPAAGTGAQALYLYMLLATMVSLDGSFAQFWGGVPQVLGTYTLALSLLGRLGRQSPAS